MKTKLKSIEKNGEAVTFYMYQGNHTTYQIESVYFDSSKGEWVKSVVYYLDPVVAEGEWVNVLFFFESQRAA